MRGRGRGRRGMGRARVGGRGAEAGRVARPPRAAGVGEDAAGAVQSAARPVSGAGFAQKCDGQGRQAPGCPPVRIGLRCCMSVRRLTACAVALALLVALAGVASAQRYFREGSFPAKYAPHDMPDASFIFCRLAYRSVRMEQSGIGWQTDYPYAEINLMTRLSELTRTRVSRDANQEPNHFVVRPTDDALFNCPFVMASDPGTVGFSEAELEPLRQYLLKGGFLWVDDFWGTPAWTQWASEIGRVLSPAEYPIEDVSLSDPLLNAQFLVTV